MTHDELIIEQKWIEKIREAEALKPSASSVMGNPTAWLLTVVDRQGMEIRRLRAVLDSIEQVVFKKPESAQGEKIK